MEDIMQNPEKYGAPSFKTFVKNRSFWKRKKDQMAILTGGPSLFRRELKRIRYFCHGKELASEEAVETMLADHGFTLDDIDLENRETRLKKEINNMPVGGGLDHEIHVNFLP